MKRNMGALDRVVRALVVAPALVVVAVLIGPVGVVSIVLYALAAVMLATGAVGFCPLYPLLHVSTCPRKPAGA